MGETWTVLRLLGARGGVMAGKGGGGEKSSLEKLPSGGRGDAPSWLSPVRVLSPGMRDHPGLPRPCKGSIMALIQRVRPDPGPTNRQPSAPGRQRSRCPASSGGMNTHERAQYNEGGGGAATERERRVVTSAHHDQRGHVLPMVRLLRGKGQAEPRGIARVSWRLAMT